MTQNTTTVAGGASPRRWGRSILAVLAGFVVVVILSLGTDGALRTFKIFPTLGQPMSDGLFLLATIYRTVYGIVGSYITARLAPDHPMGHAMTGGWIGFALSIAGAAATWKHIELGPHWYPVTLVVTALPSAWLGGKIREIQINNER